MTLRKRSWALILIVCGLLISSIFAFYNCCFDLIPLSIISIANAYLLSLLFVGAIISDSPDPVKHASKLNIFPNRVAALTIMILFFSIFTFSFAALYNNQVEWKHYPFPYKNSFECIYSSFITLTTLSTDILNPDTVYLKKIVMLEIFSSLNLLIGSVSFLLSRLSSF